MKVLRLIGGLDPAHGGPPVSSMHSIIAASRAGADTTLAFPIEPPRSASVDAAIARLENEGVRVISFEPPKPLSPRARSWGMNRAMAGWIRHESRQYDIVHCHGAWQMATLLATLAGRRARQASVLTPHESLTQFDIDQSSAGWLRRVKKHLRRRYLRRFDLIVMSSHIEAEDSIPPDMDRPASLTVISHPVYDETIRQARPRVPTIGPQGLRLGFLGRLHQKKNVDILIRALPRLGERVSLTVAGDGPERDALTALARDIGVSERVHWLGFVQDDAKADFFRHIDLLTMPSDYECFGMAAAEAMVAGVPVVVSPRTGIAELIRTKGGGEIAQPDPNDFGRVVGQLSHQPDRLADLSRQAIEAAAADLSFAAHGAALVARYERILKPGGR